jgi:LacI family transcriptional regulator
MKSPRENGNLVVFDLDPVQPWVPGIYRGLCESPHAAQWDVRLTAYQGRSLLAAEPLLSLPRARPLGVITQRPFLAALASRKKVPVILYGYQTGEDDALGVPLIRTNYPGMAEMAARHLLERGYSALTIVGGGPEGVTQWKTQGFLHALERDNRAAAFVRPPEIPGDEGWMDDDAIRNLADWFRGIDRPLGVAAVNVRAAWGVSRALRGAGKRVPEDVGLLAVGEDPVLLGQARPPVTGVAEDGYAKGRLCAEYLMALREGRDVPLLTTVAPWGLVERASTQHFAVSDPTVSKALALIRDEVENLEGVDALARRCFVSRATLLRRFREHRGRTPAEEIRQGRLRRAIELIEGTHLPMAEVAVAAGFGLQSALSRAVRQATGRTPTECRRQP